MDPTGPEDPRSNPSRGPPADAGPDDLLRRLAPLIRSVVARFAQDAATADDLAQACRIRIYRKHGQCRDPDAILGWARTLCMRVCLKEVDRIRRERKRLAERPDTLTAVASPAPDPLRHAELAELRAHVRSALRRLPKEDRSLLIERYWRGAMPGEMARALDVPPATVRTRLRRARLRLGADPELAPYCPRDTSGNAR